MRFVIAFLFLTSCCYGQHFRKSYYYPQTYYAAPVYAAPVGWKTELLRIAEAKDKYQQQLKLQLDDNKVYLEALSALGYSVPVKQGLIAEQGSTVYGLKYSDVSELYGSLSIDLHFNQADNHVRAAQDLASKVYKVFNLLFKQKDQLKSELQQYLLKLN